MASNKYVMFIVDLPVPDRNVNLAAWLDVIQVASIRYNVITSDFSTFFGY